MSDSYDDYELGIQLAEQAWEVQHHKNRAARWRAEAYKQAGHDKIELPWVGLTDEEIKSVCYSRDWTAPWTDVTFARAIEAKLREKNHG
jgi:hypothetical protein